MMQSQAATPSQRPVPHPTGRLRLLIVSATAAFLIYASAALVLHQKQRDDFIQERSSIAAAISNVYYGTTLGTVYAGVLERMLDFTVPLEKILVQGANREIPAKGLLPTTADGNGIGYIVVSALSFRLLGPHTQSMVIAMLGLMAVSAGAFLYRFRDHRAAVVVLYFTVLTVMLSTPLAWYRPYELNMSIGAIRYFTLVAMLPAFHLLLETADTRVSIHWREWRKMLPLVLQIVILILAVLVRNSAAPTIAAIITGCLFFAWRGRHDPVMKRRALRKAIYMAVITAAFVGTLMLSVSKNYVRDGKFTEVVWHRIFLSIGTNPDWPFPGVRQLYDCTKYIPEGMVSAMEDRNSHCVLWVYAIKHHIPVDIVSTWTHGREHEKALREAFFDILYRYPVDTMKSFIIHKPRYIAWSVAHCLNLTIASLPPVIMVLLLAALANLGVFAAATPSLSASGALKTVAGTTALLALFGATPHMLVWALPSTSGELVFYALCTIGLVLVAIIQMARDKLLPAQ